MKVINIHSRLLSRPASETGALIDTLASADDRLWPREEWPAMRLDGPLSIGAVGGHGPIGYRVQAHEPGVRVRFRFTFSSGFQGFHEFSARSGRVEGESVLTHRLMIHTAGATTLWWLLVIRPLHDALIEDALSKAERELTGSESPVPWSPWVVAARLLFRGRYGDRRKERR